MSAKSNTLVSGQSSQKQAVIDEVVLFDSPAVRPYLHPSGMFSYEVPATWTIQNTAHGITAQSPNAIVLSATVMNTGYILSSMSFLRLASNTETTHYGNEERYVEVSRKEDRLNRLVFVEKTYTQNGTRKLAMSIYRQVGQSMYLVEMVGDRMLITSSPKYEALFSNFNDSIRDRQDPNAILPAYSTSWKFVEADNDYSMEIPVGWKLVTDQPEPGLTHNEFNSPDGNAVIETFLLKQGEIVVPRFAAQYALNLLETSYGKGSDDIRVTSEVILKERTSGKITWLSRSGGYAGVTYFEVRNRTHVFILTRAWNRLFEDIYKPVVDTAVLSFKSGSSSLR